MFHAYTAGVSNLLPTSDMAMINQEKWKLFFRWSGVRWHSVKYQFKAMEPEEIFASARQDHMLIKC